MLKIRENTDLDYYLTEIKFPEQLKPSQSQVSFAFVFNCHTFLIYLYMRPTYFHLLNTIAHSIAI